MAERYWIDVFNPTTWPEFLAAGGTVSGFTERQRNTVDLIQLGDVLLAYVAGISRWIGVLEVTRAHFTDPTPVWSDGVFPERVGVRVLRSLDLETAVPAADLRDSMKLFASLQNPNKWSIFFRRSPTQISAEDARVVIDAIEAAIVSPVVRPIAPGLLRSRPRRMDEVEPEDESPVIVPSDDEAAPAVDEALLAVEDSQPAPTARDYSIETEHTEIQWLLLKLGSDMGQEVWVARNDRSRTWHGHAFTDLPRLRLDLPRQFDPMTSRIIEMIDVLWLDGSAITAAFEIESTTSIYSGLLRMSDLLALQPNLNIPLFLVAPDERRNKVITEVNRPTFARLPSPLVDVCRYISFTTLREQVAKAAPLLRYLRPAFLQELSESCEPAG
jgi:hypothetical protein